MNSPIMTALKQFEATEANLIKLENLWSELQDLLPEEITLGESSEYEDRGRALERISSALPGIDGWKLTVVAPDWDAIMSTRLDFIEIGEPLDGARFENTIWEQGREIREYRYRLNQKRRELIRDALVSIIDNFDANLNAAAKSSEELQSNANVTDASWEALLSATEQIEVLLGSSVEKPPRWTDLKRHLHFGMRGDLDGIARLDWPAVKAGLQRGLYGENEALPVEASDLGELVATKPKGPVIAELAWSNLTADDFERLIFSLITGVRGYENPEWLMRTNAPDRGRDLSVTRVLSDPLSGVIRDRVIIQCKHWLSRSVSLNEVMQVVAQADLWGEPPVTLLIIATSGRFTTDAVQWIEQRNHRRDVPMISMWPESHLESLLAARPDLIAQFKLR